MPELHLEQLRFTYSACILKYEAYKIARNCKYDEYQRALASMVYAFFDKKIWSKISANEHPAEELNKPVIKTFKRRKSMQDLTTIFGHQI